MSVRVRIGLTMRRISKGQSEVWVEASTISDVVAGLEQQFPGFRAKLTGGDGQLVRFVNVFLNGEDVRFLQGASTPLKSGDEVSIVPAVSGGSPSFS